MSHRGIYTVSAVTYCNHMLIIPSCTKIVPAHSICSSLSLSLFTGFSSFIHFSILMAPPPPHLSLYKLPSLVLQSSTHFFLITFPPHDLFHSVYWVCDALHRLWEPLCLCQGSDSLLFLSSSVHLCCPDLKHSDGPSEYMRTNCTYKHIHTDLNVGLRGSSRLLVQSNVNMKTHTSHPPCSC